MIYSIFSTPCMILQYEFALRGQRKNSLPPDSDNSVQKTNHNSLVMHVLVHFLHDDLIFHSSMLRCTLSAFDGMKMYLL